MPLAVIHSRASAGIHAVPVAVETHITGGLPKLSIVGLPETAVKESKDRVRSALINSQFDFPARRITVNLAPADLPKDGGRFDLPIALGILVASGQLPAEALVGYEFAGELALSGELRPVQGSLPFALATQKAKRKLVVPLANADEACLPGDVEVFPAQHLLDICAHFLGKQTLAVHVSNVSTATDQALPDLAEVHGQQQAKRVLALAAAGGHSLLLIGPPGTGKTMLATRLPSILPVMTNEEALEAAAIASISRVAFDPKKWRQRPFRGPHHTASAIALVGGGSPPRPGEISLAHNGVLFLDELPEFNRHVLETLREPLESGKITISRAARQAEFPANFQLIAAMNPCPCGHWGNPNAPCRCTQDQILRYHRRLSGPFLDRIDMQLEVPPLATMTLMHQQAATTPSSAEVRAQVVVAHERQLTRAGKANAVLSTRELAQYCKLDQAGQEVLSEAVQKFKLSSRAYHRVLKVARTIADLGGSKTLVVEHVAEALGYRDVIGRYGVV